MKNTDKNQPKQGQGKIKPPVRPAKVEQSEEERKQAEEALRESEEKYRSLVERANDGITIIQDGVVKFANTRLVEMWGCTVEEVLETLFANYIHPNQLPAMVERYQQRMAGEDIPPMYETVLLRSDGSKVYVEINAGVIAYLGKPADLVMVRDVTERKRAEELLQRERNQAQQYLDIAGVMMTALDSNGRITLVNKKGCEILGYENEQELIGRDWFETCLPPHIKGDVKKVIDQLMAGDISPVEYHENPVLTKAGKECVIAFHNTVIRDAASNITGILFSGEDITERKRAEQALRKKDEHHRKVVENILRFVPEGLLVFTKNLNLVEQNKAFEEITQQYAARLGYTEQELADLIADQVRSRLLSGDTTEIHIPKKRR